MNLPTAARDVPLAYPDIRASSCPPKSFAAKHSFARGTSCQFSSSTECSPVDTPRQTARSDFVSHGLSSDSWSVKFASDCAWPAKCKSNGVTEAQFAGPTLYYQSLPGSRIASLAYEICIRDEDRMARFYFVIGKNAIDFEKRDANTL
jgi:hypothetical protein